MVSTSLPPTSWPAAIDLFNQVVELDGSGRESILNNAGLSPAVVREVRALLAAHDSADGMLDRPAGLARLDLESTFAASLAGHRVGVWDVVRKIGQGGMGAVYEAVRADDAVRQRVALKTLALGADIESIVVRFRRERQILATLQHPNIATLLDAGVTDLGTPYFAMEFVDGRPIDAWCAERRLGLTARLDLFQQACAAVEYAHQRLVVHRDLKPSNILVSNEGVVKLVDFGIAKLLERPNSGEETTAGATPLTIAYASPEQARGQAMSTATDVYSLGAVLYRLLAGVAPFSASGRPLAELLAEVATTEPPPPSVTCTAEAATHSGLPDRVRLVRALAGELDAIVMMAMRREPERRYATVSALGEDVRRYLRGLPVAARPDSLGYRFQKFVARRRAVAVAATLAVFSVLAFSGLALWQARAARAEAARTLRVSHFLQAVLGAGDLVTGSVAMPLGPRASMSALLDSAVRRIPLEFADEPGARARLYTTMATGLMSQSRMSDAARLLDSARFLSRESLGEASLEFAQASIGAGAAATHRDRLVDAERFSADAERSLTARGETKSELFARMLVDRSAIHLVRGNWAMMRTLARRADSLEQQRAPGQPTYARAVARNRLSVFEFAQGRYRAADSGFAHALALLDSVHAPLGIERIDALSDGSDAAIYAGNVVRSDSLAFVGLTQATSAFGPDSREAAVFLAKVGLIKGRRGDALGAEATLRRAVRIVDSIPDVVAVLHHQVEMSLAEFLVSQRRWAQADSVLTSVDAHTGTKTSALSEAVTYLYWGNVRAALRKFASSEAYLTRAEDAFGRSGVVSTSLRQLILGNLASLYLRTNRPEMAQPYLDSLPVTLQQGVRAFVARERVADAAALRRDAGQPR